MGEIPIYERIIDWIQLGEMRALAALIRNAACRRKIRCCHRNAQNLGVAVAEARASAEKPTATVANADKSGFNIEYLRILRGLDQIWIACEGLSFVVVVIMSEWSCRAGANGADLTILTYPS